MRGSAVLEKFYQFPIVRTVLINQSINQSTNRSINPSIKHRYIVNSSFSSHPSSPPAPALSSSSFPAESLPNCKVGIHNSTQTRLILSPVCTTLTHVNNMVTGIYPGDGSSRMQGFTHFLFSISTTNSSEAGTLLCDVSIYMYFLPELGENKRYIYVNT